MVNDDLSAVNAVGIAAHNVVKSIRHMIENRLDHASLLERIFVWPWEETSPSRYSEPLRTYDSGGAKENYYA
jgi:hypothetical protein